MDEGLSTTSSTCGRRLAMAENLSTSGLESAGGKRHCIDYFVLGSCETRSAKLECRLYKWHEVCSRIQSNTFKLGNRLRQRQIAEVDGDELDHLWDHLGVDDDARFCQ
ncbi:MAG: hypothetical protein ABSB99_11300 [Acidimicrobiales bacterium]